MIKKLFIGANIGNIFKSDKEMEREVGFVGGLKGKKGCVESFLQR